MNETQSRTAAMLKDPARNEKNKVNLAMSFFIEEGHNDIMKAIITKCHEQDVPVIDLQFANIRLLVANAYATVKAVEMTSEQKLAFLIAMAEFFHEEMDSLAVSVLA